MSDARPPGDPDEVQAALAALVAVARRLEAVVRMAPPAGDPLLTAVVQTAATVLDAQAASIALHDAETDRLVFAAAAGPSAGEVVGLAIDASSGIAGYAYSTGQPLAVADVAADPRFDRTVAEATGYLPGSILATPLSDDEGTVGVLEVLDRRGGSFTLRDLEIAAALAREATIIVRRGRIGRDTGLLLRAALGALADAGGTDRRADETAFDTAIARAIEAIAGEDDDPTWRLADRIARLRDVDPGSVELVIDWLDALLRRRARGYRPPGGSTIR